MLILVSAQMRISEEPSHIKRLVDSPSSSGSQILKSTGKDRTQRNSIFSAKAEDGAQTDTNETMPIKRKMKRERKSKFHNLINSC